MVSEEGELVGASWRAMVPKAKEEAEGKKGGVGNGRGEFEMVVQERGVRAVIEKAAAGGKGKKGGDVKGEGGEGGEVEEKTFLQKWVRFSFEVGVGI